MDNVEEIRDKHLAFCNVYLKKNIRKTIENIENRTAKEKMIESFNDETFKKLVSSNTVDKQLIENLERDISSVGGRYFYLTQKGSKKIVEGQVKEGRFSEVINDIFLNTYNLFSNKDDTKKYSHENYPDEFSWNSYEYVKKSGIHVCPYCNSEFIYTQLEEKREFEKIEGVKVPRITVRPQLDHFIPKEKRPVLAISIFNLVPCCKTCNSSIKHDKELNNNHFMNPLFEDIYSNISFSNIHKKSEDHYSSITGRTNDFEISILKRNSSITQESFRKAENTVRFFRIKDRYEPYKSYIQYKISRELLYSKLYSENLENAYPKLFNKGEIERLKKSVDIDYKDFIFSRIVEDFLYK